jgi:hypothetical protein
MDYQTAYETLRSQNDQLAQENARLSAEARQLEMNHSIRIINACIDESNKQNLCVDGLCEIIFNAGLEIHLGKLFPNKQLQLTYVSRDQHRQNLKDDIEKLMRHRQSDSMTPGHPMSAQKRNLDREIKQSLTEERFLRYCYNENVPKMEKYFKILQEMYMDDVEESRDVFADLDVNDDRHIKYTCMYMNKNDEPRYRLLLLQGEVGFQFMASHLMNRSKNNQHKMDLSKWFKKSPKSNFYYRLKYQWDRVMADKMITEGIKDVLEYGGKYIDYNQKDPDDDSQFSNIGMTLKEYEKRDGSNLLSNLLPN